MKVAMSRMTLWVVVALSGLVVHGAEREGAFDSYPFMFQERRAGHKAARSEKAQPQDRKDAVDTESATSDEESPEEAAAKADEPPAEADEVVLTDEALPPPGVMRVSQMVPGTRSSINGVNLGGRDITRATFGRQPVQPGPGRVGAGLVGVEGRFTYSIAGERKPIPLFVQYGFVTVIEFKNGQYPTGGAFCGLCGDTGVFDVQALSNRVGIKPREMSSEPGGTLATNLTIITDRDVTYTFNVVEITGLGLVRTDRHEIRAASADGGSILGFSFQDRVNAARRELEREKQEDVAEARQTIVSEKAAENLETGYKVTRRRGDIEVESVATIGNETLVKLFIPKGKYSDPVAVVERGRRKKRQVSLVSRRSTMIQDRGDLLEVTITLEAVELDDNERLRITLVDKATGEELRASIEAA